MEDLFHRAETSHLGIHKTAFCVSGRSGTHAFSFRVVLGNTCILLKIPSRNRQLHVAELQRILQENVEETAGTFLPIPTQLYGFLPA